VFSCERLIYYISALIEERFGEHFEEEHVPGLKFKCDLGFKRNIGREAGFYIIAGRWLDKNTMARCGKVIHD
jgi:hypothetical protein